MNTVFTKEEFFAVRNAWKNISSNKQNTAEDHYLYNLIRGVDGTRGFSPITRPIKLANGLLPMRGYNDASWRFTHPSLVGLQALQKRFPLARSIPIEKLAALVGVKLTS